MKKVELGILEKRKLLLDLERLSETRLLVTASSGGGKSWLLRRIIEQAYGKIQIIILDTEGEFSTLRPAYDFVILGENGDVGLNPRYAGVYAKKFLETGRDLVVDLFELEIPQKKAFVRDFLNTMVNSPRNLWHDVLVILDESHEFAPEGGHSESSSAVISMASKGRKRGFGLLLATQRLAKLSKDAAAECRNKLVGLANLPDDRKRGAEELGFTSKDEILTLRDMPEGDFYACGPAFSTGSDRLRGVVCASVIIPNTRPPKRGLKKGFKPKASLKLKAELAKLADLPKEAEEEIRDVTGLKLKIRELEEALRKPKAAVPITSTSFDKKILEAAREQGFNEGLVAQKHSFLKSLPKFTTEIMASIQKLEKEANSIAGSLIPKTPLLHPILVSQKPTLFKPDLKLRESIENIPLSDDEPRFGTAEKLIVSVLNMERDVPMSKEKLAARAGYSVSGHFMNTLGALTTRGIIEREHGLISIKNGVDVSSIATKQPKTLEDWMRKLGKGETALLKVLKDSTNRLSKEELAEASGYKVSGNFQNILGHLNTLGLIRRENGMVSINPDLLYSGEV